MNKKIRVFVLVLVLFLFTIMDVKADGPVGGHIGLESDGYYHYYDNEQKNNEYVIEPGDEIEVTYVIHNWNYGYNGKHFLDGGSVVFYYDNIFENINMQVINSEAEVSGHIYNGRSAYQFGGNGYLLKTGINPIFKIILKVSDDAKNGVYHVYTHDDFNDDIECIDEEGNLIEYFNYESVLTFRIGEKNIGSDVLSSSIENSTYVIGNHMFTRSGSEKYDGTLTTRHIMLASKSIDSNDTDDMIIYYKNAHGNWVDAINNVEIEVPESFEITYKDLLNYSTMDVNIPTPVITGPIGEPTYENGLYYYKFKLNNPNDYILDGEYLADYYELYVQYDDGPIMITESTSYLDEEALIGVEPGCSFKVYARAKKYDEFGTIYHSDFSESIEVEWTLSAPVLNIGLSFFDTERSAIDHELAINWTYDEVADKLCFGGICETTMGWKIYEKDGSNYNEVEYGGIYESPNYTEKKLGDPIEIWVPYGEKKTYVAVAFLDEGNDRIYSNYSNEIVLDYRTLDAPEIRYEANPSGEPNEDNLPIGYDGEINKYRHDVHINYEDYQIRYDQESVNDLALGWEIYEVNDKIYTKVADGDDDQIDLEEVFELRIPNGEKKVFIARVFAKDEHGQRFYSDYSEPLTFDYTKLETPTLVNPYEQELPSGENPWQGYNSEDNEFMYDLGIDSSRYYVFLHEDESIIAGWELCDAQTHTVVEDGDKEAGDPVTVYIPNGEKRSYVARVYGLNSEGSKFYSEFSDIMTIDHTTLPTPKSFSTSLKDELGNPISLSYDAEKNSFPYDLGFDWEKYTYGEDEDAYSIIDGWEVREVVNGNYVEIENGIGEVGSPVTVYVPIGEKKEFVMRVFTTKSDGSKVYSNDSEILKLDQTNIPTPILTAPIGGEETFDLVIDGFYADDIEIIDGVELYEVVGNDKVLIDTYDETTITLSKSENINKTFVARVYIENSKGQTIYSDYSEPFTLSE